MVGNQFAHFSLCRLSGVFGGQCFTCLPKSAFRRIRIPSVAIRRLNTTVQPMNDKLGALVSTNLSSSIYCLFLSGIVATGALSSATFYVPATIGIVNDMMRRTSYTITPCVP